MRPKIGVFDSGLGGLTVLRKLLTHYPADYIYLADTANIPFGSKSQEQLKTISAAIVSFLQKQGVDICVIACHTASVVHYFLQEEFPTLTFVNAVDPVVAAALRATEVNRIGVLATPATITSHIHRTRLLDRNPDLTIIEQSSHRLVPCIESQSYTERALRAILREDLVLFQQNNIDTLILGSTHYAVIKQQIQEMLPASVKLVGAEDYIAAYLPKNNSSLLPSKIEFFVTDHPQLFKEKSATMLLFPISGVVTKIVL